MVQSWKCCSGKRYTCITGIDSSGLRNNLSTYSIERTGNSQNSSLAGISFRSQIQRRDPAEKNPNPSVGRSQFEFCVPFRKRSMIWWVKIGLGWKTMEIKSLGSDGFRKREVYHPLFCSDSGKGRVCRVARVELISNHVAYYRSMLPENLCV